MKRRIITLTTDFSARDGFVGIMKGVIFSIAPEVTIVDIGHEVAAQEVLEGQFLLEQAVPYFPKGTIHVAVIDPGVGTSRRPLAVETKNEIFVGPDNGLFTPWLDGAKVYHLTNAKYFLDNPSATFHGRDIFAPVAAHIARGVAPSQMGSPIKNPVRLAIPKPKIAKGSITGEVIHIDRFGNLITNIPASAVERLRKNAGKCTVKIGRKKIVGIKRTYGSGSEPVAFIGSHRHLEIAVPMGSANEKLRAKKGECVELMIAD